MQGNIVGRRIPIVHFVTWCLVALTAAAASCAGPPGGAASCAGVPGGAAGEGARRGGGALRCGERWRRTLAGPAP
jgi:hypothetical protein